MIKCPKDNKECHAPECPDCHEYTKAFKESQIKGEERMLNDRKSCID